VALSAGGLSSYSQTQISFAPTRFTGGTASAPSQLWL